MGVVIPLGYAQVNMRFFLTGDTEAMVVTIGVDPGTITSPIVLADSVHAALVTAGTIFQESSYSANYQIGPFEATIMTSTGPQTGIGNALNEGENSLVSSLPNNCAILVQKRTARGGREGRGRSYFPVVYPTEAAIGPTGVLDSNTFDAWQTAMNDFLAQLATDNTPMVLLHSEATGPLAPDPVISLTVDGRVATQRNRLRP